MILIDTSAWVEFLRDTGSPACEQVDRLLQTGAAITDPISMEVLSGARSERHVRDLRGMLARAYFLRCTPPDFDAAALLYRSCRARGVTVRKLMDCLIAAVAIRTASPLLHADSDFTLLARHTPLAEHAASLRDA